MGATEKRMEQLGIRLQQTDWRGKGTVDAVLAGGKVVLVGPQPREEGGGTGGYGGRGGGRSPKKKPIRRPASAG